MTEHELDETMKMTARIVRSALAGPVPAEVATRHERLLLAAARGHLPSEQVTRRRRLRRVVVGALAAAMVLGSSLVALASDRAVPGDPLYGLDRAFERVQLVMARSPEAKASTRLEIAAERLREVRMLRSARAPSPRIKQAAREAVEANAAALAAADQVEGEALKTQVLAEVERHLEGLREVRGSLQESEDLQKEIDTGARALEKVRNGRDGEIGRGEPGRSRIDRSAEGRSRSRGVSSRTRSRTTPEPASPSAGASPAASESPGPSPTPSHSPSPSPGA